MAVSEPQRLALHRAARAALDEEEGDTLMALSPPANTDMATRQDLERTEERLDAKIDAAAARLDAKIDHVAELLETKMAARIRSSELSTRLWTFLMIASAQVASVAYLRNVLG